MAKEREKAFFCGRKFEIDEQGRLVPVGNSEGTSRGKYGEDTVTMRVPVSIVPLLQLILGTVEQIEIVRRNIEGNVLNTSPELLGCDTMKERYAEDWRRAVSYAMRASTAMSKRHVEDGSERKILGRRVNPDD